MGIGKQSKNRQGEVARIGMLELPTLQGDIINSNTRFKLFDGAITGRFRSDKSNIQEIPRGKFSDYYIDKTSDEWKFEQCRLKEKDVDYRYCGQCDQRFQCWTAGRPQSINVFGDTHIGLQKLQQAMSAQMITVDEASEAFKNLSEVMVQRLNETLGQSIQSHYEIPEKSW